MAACRSCISHIRACTSCSLKDLCLPKLQKAGTVADYYAGRFQEEGL